MRSLPGKGSPRTVKHPPIERASSLVPSLSLPPGTEAPCPWPDAVPPATRPLLRFTDPLWLVPQVTGVPTVRPLPEPAFLVPRFRLLLAVCLSVSLSHPTPAFLLSCLFQSLLCQNHPVLPSCALQRSQVAPPLRPGQNLSCP